MYEFCLFFFFLNGGGATTRMMCGAESRRGNSLFSSFVFFFGKLDLLLFLSLPVAVGGVHVQIPTHVSHSSLPLPIEVTSITYFFKPPSDGR